MRAGFGTPKYGGGSNFKKTGSPQPDSDTEIRILPPMFSLVETGQWRQYWTTHWGFAGVSSQDPTKTTMRPFRCIRDVDFRTKMVRQECPACVQYEQIEAQAKEEEAALLTNLKAQGLNDAQIAERVEAEMASIKEWLKGHRIERKHYVNVMYKDGTFGDFKLNSKDHMTRIRAIIEGEEKPGKPRKPGLLETDGIDPLDLDQGVWFVIHRTGKGFGTPDTVDVKRTKVEATVAGKLKMLEEIELAPLTEEQSTRALKECRDLTTLGGTTLTYDQIDALVKCSGDPQEIDEIMGIKREAAKPAAQAVPASRFTPPAPKTAASAPAPKASSPAPAPVAAAAPAAAPAAKPAMSDAVKARLAEIQAKQAAEEAAKKAAEEAAAKLEAETANGAATTGEPDPMNMSDEDFMKFFGNGAPTA